MKNVCHGLITYFHTINPSCETYISSASNKLRPFEEAKCDTYAQRKDSAELIVARLLNEAVRDRIEADRHLGYAKWFAALKKRDDVSDAYLHAYYGLLLRGKPVKKKATTVGSMTTNQLKEQLKARGLAVSGKKSVLADRLRTAKAQEAGRTSKTVPQLKQELIALGLETTGTKADLAKRLFAAQKPLKKAKAKREASPKRLVI